MIIDDDHHSYHDDEIEDEEGGGDVLTPELSRICSPALGNSKSGPWANDSATLPLKKRPSDICKTLCTGQCWNIMAMGCNPSHQAKYRKLSKRHQGLLAVRRSQLRSSFSVSLDLQQVNMYIEKNLAPAATLSTNSNPSVQHGAGWLQPMNCANRIISLHLFAQINLEIPFSSRKFVKCTFIFYAGTTVLTWHNHCISTKWIVVSRSMLPVHRQASHNKLLRIFTQVLS